MSDNIKVEVVANAIASEIQEFRNDNLPNTGMVCRSLGETSGTYTPEDLDFITAEIEKKNGVSFSWRIVPETEHCCKPGEVIIQFCSKEEC